ncbi:MAG TPA: hypothetical protein VFR58_14495 [Flavisolibacter sp.]|nr:hypothetical protein [Flavisolibacter sp.]
MKSAFRKLVAVSKPSLFRSLFFSILFLAFYFIVLYVLINSPA